MSVPMDCPGFGRLVGDAAALIGDVPEPGDRAHPSPGFGNPLPGIGARGNGRLDYTIGVGRAGRRCRTSRCNSRLMSRFSPAWKNAQ